MKLGVLFSGGKDSTYALFKTLKEAVCLISVISKNKESYMFHTPNIEITKLQAKAIGLPLIQKITEGRKEEELEDLKEVIEEAKEKFKIEGIVTGAVESVYQSSRVQKICDELSLKCINPLWKKDQEELLKEEIESGFEIIVTGVYAEGFDESWLGRSIDKKTLEELILLKEKFGINIVFEGGEAETLVVDCPLFKKRIRIIEAEKLWDEKTMSGTFVIKQARIVEK
ncbi:MAG: TIGR00289 family protein [Thaumarchaeota archaeon]|nr:TIGR00289 family protein [Nitrososphaerota archaeon]